MSNRMSFSTITSLPHSSVPVYQRHDGNKNDNLIEIPSRPKKFKCQNVSFEDFEHSHFLTKIESVINKGEFYECMECMVRFETSAQLLQHLDNHICYQKQKGVKDKFQCLLCSYLPKDDLSDEKAQDAIRKHTILEHFKAHIPPNLIKGPVDTSNENDEKEVNIDMAPSANSIQDEVFRCSICPRSFDQSYQRRIHERYIHQKMSEEVTQQVKCPSCKSLSKNDRQYVCINDTRNLVAMLLFNASDVQKVLKGFHF